MFQSGCVSVCVNVVVPMCLCQCVCVNMFVSMCLCQCVCVNVVVSLWVYHGGFVIVGVSMLLC